MFAMKPFNPAGPDCVMLSVLLLLPSSVVMVLIAPKRLFDVLLIVAVLVLPLTSIFAVVLYPAVISSALLSPVALAIIFA